MPFPQITPELIARIEGFQVRFNTARMEALQALPGNPYGVEVRPFGHAVAYKARSPLLRSKNRILGFRADDAPLLDEMLAYFREEGLRCTISVSHGEMTEPLFRQLVGADLWSAGSGTIPVIVPDAAPAPPPPSDIQIQESGPAERDRYLALFARAFSHREEGQAGYLAFQWAEDTLPGCRRYIAEIAGVPVGMASFPILDGLVQDQETSWGIGRRGRWGAS